MGQLIEFADPAGNSPRSLMKVGPERTAGMPGRSQ